MKALKLSGVFLNAATNSALNCTVYVAAMASFPALAQFHLLCPHRPGIFACPIHCSACKAGSGARSIPSPLATSSYLDLPLPPETPVLSRYSASAPCTWNHRLLDPHSDEMASDNLERRAAECRRFARLLQQ